MRKYGLESLTALLLTLIPTGPVLADGGALDAPRLLRDGTAEFDNGCQKVVESERLDHGSVPRRYLTACQVPQVDSRERDPIRAKLLLDEGRAHIESACRKYEESFRLSPEPDTLLDIATCHIARSKPSTARDTCLEARRLATEKADLKTLAGAKSCIAWIEPKLSYLTIRVAAAPPQLEVQRGNDVVGSEMFGKPVAVDPGEYLITARAEGYRRFERTITIGEEPSSKEITIPQLEKIGGGPGAWPWVVGGIGLAALATGTISGILAIDSNHQLVTGCSAEQQCSAEVWKAQDRRNTQAWVANVGIPAGVVGVGAAITWIWLSGRRSDANARSGAARLLPVEVRRTPETPVLSAAPMHGGVTVSLAGRF